MCSTPSSRPAAEVGGTITALIAPAAAEGSKDAAKSAAIDSGFIRPEPLASPAISWGPGLAESTFVSGAEPKAAATRCKASASFSSLVGILPPSLVAAFVNSIGVNPDMAQKGMRDRVREAQFSFDRDDHSFTWAKMETFCSSEHCRHIHAFQQASQAKWKNGSKWDDPGDGSLKFFFSTPTVEIFLSIFLGEKRLSRSLPPEENVSTKPPFCFEDAIFAKVSHIKSTKCPAYVACPTNRATLWHCHLSTLLPLSQWPDKNSMAIHRTGSAFLKKKLRAMWFSWYDITGELSVLAVQQNGWWFLTQLVSHVNHHTLRVPFFMWSNSSNPGGVFWRVFNSTTEFHVCFQNFYIIGKFYETTLISDSCFSCNSSWSSKDSSAIAVDSPPSNALEVSARPRFWPATNELLAVLVEESVDWQTICNRNLLHSLGFL